MRFWLNMNQWNMSLPPPEDHEGHNHPDLTTPLLGLSAGDEKTFTLTYPEEFGDDRYAGKDITFEIEVLSLKEKEVDPLDDEFAQSISDFETFEELKADIEKKLRTQRQDQLGLSGPQRLRRNGSIRRLSVTPVKWKCTA